jgi:phosphinothricin acetyltransferase
MIAAQTTRIRPARDSDTEAITHLQRHIVDTTLMTFATEARSLSDWQEDILYGDPPILVAEDTDGEFLGYATYTGFRSSEGYRHTAELSIYLSEAARGRGAGRKLLTELENRAVQGNIHVMVAAISSANPTAQQFHAACGYTEVGRLPQVGRKWDQWLDLVLMQKILREDGTAPPDSAVNPG